MGVYSDVHLSVSERLRILRAALARVEDDSDYCYVCDQHPSTGHADDCLMRPADA